MTHPLTEAQKKDLAAQLPRDVIRKLPGKSAADYVSGHYVIERLNAVFGFDGWFDTYEAPAVREGDRPTIYVRGSLTAAGVTRGDIGVGVAANATPDAFETAIKASYTDCLKRCARKLGDSFGLALYEKVLPGEMRAGVGLSTTALAMRDEIALLSTLAQVNDWARSNAAAVDRLDSDERDIVKGDVAARRCDLAPAPAQDATPSRPPETAPAPPQESAALATYRARCAAATTLDLLTATCLELAPTVKEHRDAAWTMARARAADLGATPEELKAGLAEAGKLSADPAAWKAASAFLAALAAARGQAAIEGVKRAHGAQLAKLPEPLRLRLSAALKAARGNGTTAPTDTAAELEAALRRASGIPEIEAAGDACEAAYKAGKITQEEIKALTKLQDALCSAQEREPEAEGQAA